MSRLALVLLALASCGRSDGAPKSGAPPKRKARVTVHEIQEREVAYVVDAVGSVEAREVIPIPARVTGAVDRADFQEGDEVTPSVVLAEIDLERFQLAEKRAEAEHSRAKAAESVAQILYTNRKKLQEEGRRQNKDWVTDEQMAGWLADLEKAKAESARTESDLKLARRNLNDARVRSPIAGVIQKKNVVRGEYVKPETVVATILDLSALHVRFTVTELESQRIAKGQEVRFRLRGSLGREHRARLFFVGQLIDEATRSVECRAEVMRDRIRVGAIRTPFSQWTLELPAPEERIRAGSFASVRVTTSRKRAIVVPERAVLPTEKGFVVFVVDGSKASLRRVEVGLRTADGVEIVGNLRPGEKIAVDGAAALRAGTEVEIVEPKP